MSVNKRWKKIWKYFSSQTQQFDVSNGEENNNTIVLLTLFLSYFVCECWWREAFIAAWQ